MAEFEDKIQFEEMRSFSKSFNDEPDGAFFALAQDVHGWGVDDWAWYAEQYEKRVKNK